MSPVIRHNLECANCKKTFCTETTQKEELKEWEDFKENNTFIQKESQPMVTICDDCHQIFMKWFNSLSDEEKRHFLIDDQME